MIARMRGRPNDAKGLDFIVIGAQRAGTTSLFEHLREHPELYLPPGKERSFFSHDETYAAGWPKFTGDTYGAGPRGALSAPITTYMYGCPLRADGEELDKPQRTGPTEHIIPERIRSLFPDIKLIAILRDPVERCVSNYRKHALDRPWFPPFERIIATLLTPDSLERSRRMGGPPFVTLGILVASWRATTPPFLASRSSSASPATSKRRRFGSCRRCMGSSARVRGSESGNPLPAGSRIKADRAAAVSVTLTERVDRQAGG